MSDPFEILRERLVAAAALDHRPVRPRRRVRVLVALAASLVLVGSAAAAVVRLTAEDSRPLRGRVPSAAGAAPSQYAVTLFPDLRAGRIGWCTAIALRGRREAAGGEGCGPAPPAAAAQIAASALVATSGSQRSIVFAVVDSRVAAVALRDGRRILPRTTSTLPFGWRAAVWFSARPDEPSWKLLNATGGRLSTELNDRAGTREAGTAPLPTRAVNSAHVPHRRCAIRVTSRAGGRAVSERVVPIAPHAVPDVNARAFLSCASAVMYLGHRRFTAAVLVDAANKRLPAADLPGQRPHGTARGIVEASGSITARRAGPAWLVVRGPGAEDRLTVLRSLATGA